MQLRASSDEQVYLPLDEPVNSGNPSEKKHPCIEDDEDLKVFEEGSGFWTRLAFYPKLIIPSVMLGASNTGATLFNGFGLYIADRTGSSSEISALGLVIFVFASVVNPLVRGSSEKVAIACAQNYGQKDMAVMRENFLRGFYLVMLSSVLLFFVVVLPLEHLLAALQLDPAICKTAASYALILYPFECLRNFRMLFINYVFAQGLNLSHGSHTSIGLLFGLPAGATWGLPKDSLCMAGSSEERSSTASSSAVSATATSKRVRPAPSLR